MITFRRMYLDEWLERSKPLMHGKVLDIGGKKDNKRGNFKPPIEKVSSWEYVNIDKSTNPDYLCDAHNIPIDDQSIDCILLCEVLEHLEEPELAVKEAFRLLKNGGRCLITMPFLFPIHADPNDYQRWTDEKLKRVLSDIGFKEIEIASMGGILAVVSDTMRFAYVNGAVNKSRMSGKIFRILVSLTQRMSLYDRKMTGTWSMITTGWGVVGIK